MRFIYEFVQSERSNGMFCDDIFGETPTGVCRFVSSCSMLLLVTNVSSLSHAHHYLFCLRILLYVVLVLNSNCQYLVFFNLSLREKVMVYELKGVVFMIIGTMLRGTTVSV